LPFGASFFPGPYFRAAGAEPGQVFAARADGRPRSGGGPVLEQPVPPPKPRNQNDPFPEFAAQSKTVERR
jgi:hypothetical protein